MNNIKRLLLGALSTLLLAAGFARAADRFDPVTKDLTISGTVLRAAESCGGCEINAPVPSCDEVEH